MNRIYQWLAGFCILGLTISSFYQKKELGLAFSLAIIGLGLIKPVQRFNIPWMMFALLLPIAVSFAFSETANNYGVGKDIFYLSSPFWFLIAGSLLSILLRPAELFRVLVLCGAAVSMIMMGILFNTGGFAALADPFHFRYLLSGESSPIGNPLAVLGAVLAACSLKAETRLFPPRISMTFFLINAAGVYMFASRTYLLLLLLFSIIWLLSFYNKSMVLLSMVVLLLGTFAALHFFDYSKDSFMYKINESVTEINSDRFDTEEEINTRYRSFETSQALADFDRFSHTEKLFGRMGAEVDLKTFIDLGGVEMRRIPVFHNGYIFLLLKTGYFGILCFLLALGYFLQVAYSSVRRMNSHYFPYFIVLIFGSVLGLFVTNYVVYSLFNIEYSMLLVCTGFVFTNIQDSWQVKEELTLSETTFGNNLIQI